MRAFVADVGTVIAVARSPEAACTAIRPRFAELLADTDWLPGTFQAPAPEGVARDADHQRPRRHGCAADQPARPRSGMGGGIGQWLLYRAGDGSLSLFSLVVPAGAETPVHDHLAWGLVGLYGGNQEEEIFAARDGALELLQRRSLAPGDFYALIPPENDIHRVRTTSADPSVSIHLLTNDTGCVWRHSYDVETGQARPFRSGYVNVACTDEQ